MGFRIGLPFEGSACHSSKFPSAKHDIVSHGEQPENQLSKAGGPATIEANHQPGAFFRFLRHGDDLAASKVMHSLLRAATALHRGISQLGVTYPLHELVNVNRLAMGGPERTPGCWSVKLLSPTTGTGDGWSRPRPGKAMRAGATKL